MPPRPVIDRLHISNHLTATYPLIETAVHIEIQQLQPRVRSAVVMMFCSAMTDARREVGICADGDRWAGWREGVGVSWCAA